MEGIMSKDTIKSSENIWKNKCKALQKQIKNLKKRERDLQKSRALWKAKYCNIKKSVGQPAKLGEQGVCLSSSLPTNSRPKSHHYTTLIIGLCISMYRYGNISFRGCQHCLLHVILSLQLSIKCPCHSTIRYWIYKFGYYRNVHSEQNYSGEYVLWIDESFCIGGERVLMIVGAKLSDIHFDRALTSQDVIHLYAGCSRQWKAEDIQPILNCIGEQLSIRYIISDCGNNLLKTFRSLHFKHVPDCTHQITNIVAGLYKKDEAFNHFFSLCNALRQKWNMCPIKSAYMPPACAYKLRFLNVFILVDWALSVLDKWQDVADSIKGQLAFLQQYRELIKEMKVIGDWVKNLFDRLKTAGFSCIQEISYCFATNRNLTLNQELFISKLQTYFSLLSKLKQDLEVERLYCCSDVIESLFGKYKMKKKNAHQKIGASVLRAPLLTGKFEPQEIIAALEKIRIEHIINYAKNDGKNVPAF